MAESPILVFRELHCSLRFIDEPHRACTLLTIMSAPPVTKNRNRRRKKRRTEDFSSDSSLSSDSEHESAVEAVPSPDHGANIAMDEVDIESETESKEENAQDVLLVEQRDELNKLKLTTINQLSLADAQERVRKDRQQLENEYLGHMATTFANDLDELRKKPDFTEHSIVMLAKTLQSGSNMFDDETLSALLQG